MSRRVLFVIRGKLGDTLAAYATVRQYVDDNTADDVTLLLRSNYAQLLAGEQGLRIVGFSSRLAMLARLAGFAFEPPFDALLVLWGFGPPIKWIARLTKARRRIYIDDRYGALYPEHPELPPNPIQSEPMWRVARMFEPNLAQPQRLTIPSLAAKRAAPAAIGIVAIADEPRRVMSVHAVRLLAEALQRLHPHLPLRLFINPADRFAAELLGAGAPKGVRIVAFPELDGIVREFGALAHLYSTDTGLAHLACAMGIPVTVFFGPTQPWKNSMPAQPHYATQRVATLGRAHCEIKTCTRPLCLERSVAQFSGGAPRWRLDDTPDECLLRSDAA